MMKKLARLVSCLGLLGTIVTALVVLACSLFAVREVTALFSRCFASNPPKIMAGGAATVETFKAKFQYKPLIIFDNDIIVMPPEDGRYVLPDGTQLPDSKYAKMELQYSGYAEYVVDLDISSKTVETNAEGRVVSVRLRRPCCTHDDVKWVDSANALRNIEGSDKRWVEWYRNHEPQFVTAYIHRNANTEENRKIAEEQTRCMVNAMIGGFAADSKQGVVIKWLDN